MSRTLRWALVAGIIFIVFVVPVGYYRAVYGHSKRLRVIVPDHAYRMGQPFAVGLMDVVQRLHFKTIINVQDDFPDPDLEWSFWDRRTVKESDICKRLNVRYIALAPDLISKREIPDHRPAAIDQFLDILDDPNAYPVLIHCKAGLHRTGVLSAVYRMEYQGWSREEAYAELRAHGFGDWVSTYANDYITQYVLTYKPGLRHGAVVGHPVTPPQEQAAASRLP